MLKLPVYLDYNATTPVDPEVLKEMLPYFSETFGNAASSDHAYGWQAAEAVALARERVANLIGGTSEAPRTYLGGTSEVPPRSIVFTSGATEAINLGLKGAYEAYASKGNHIITCVTEHRALLDTCQHLEKLGASVTCLGVDEKGNIDLNELEASITDSTILIALMYANNETGVIHPVKEISSIAKKHKVLFLCDGTQAVGKIKVNVDEDGIDLLAFSSHKIYGPKGVGALYVRRKDPRVRLIAQTDGGGHEDGLRSGTLNVPGIVGFGKACTLASDTKRIGSLRDKLENTMLDMEGTKLNGDKNNRLPNVTNIAFANAPELLRTIRGKVAASSGSACSSASPEPSHVLKAMGLNDEMAHNSIRFSLGKNTTEKEIEFVIQELSGQLLAVR